MHSRYTRFLAGLEKADAGHFQNKSNLPHYSPEQRERLAAGLTTTPGITTFAEGSCPTDLRHPEHSHHGLFAQTRATLSNEYARWGMQPDPARLDREAACCVVAARDERMSQVGGLQLSFTDGRLDRPAVLLRQNPADEFSARASVSAAELAQAPEVARSSLRLQAVEQQLALLNQQDQQQRQEREMAQTSARMA